MRKVAANRVIFDKFGNRFETHNLGKALHTIDNGAIYGASGNMANKMTINFEIVHG